MTKAAGFDIQTVMMSQLNPKLLDMLVCPFTKTSLTLSDDQQHLISAKAQVAFPIKNGVPILCADAARPLTPEEEDALERHRHRKTSGGPA
ncbi:MAG: Trm112 family protein [Pseudomonadota bacterium]